MKVLSVLALVLFVGANSFAQNGAGTTGAGTTGAGAAPTQQAAPADTSGSAMKSEKPMKKEHHKKKKSKKKAAAE